MCVLRCDGNERVCLALQETVNKQGLPLKLEGTLCKLRHIANKYTSKSALGEWCFLAK